MSKNSQHPENQSGALKIKWVVALLAVLMVATVVMNLPRGFSDDLTRIGKGKAAVVLVRDKNATQSFDLMDELNGLRDKFSGKAEFLLTDFDTPEGRAFVTANDAGRLAVVVFDARGNKVNILYPPQTADSLQQAINAAVVAAR